MKILKKSYGKKTMAWLIASNLIKSFSQWGILTTLIKFFSTTDVGYYNLGLALTAPIFALSDMQLKSILVVEPSNENENYLTYLLIRHLTTLFATLGLIVYCLIFREINWIIVCVILYKAIESLIDIMYGYMQKKDVMMWMSVSDIAKSILSISMCFIITILFRRINISQLSLVLISIIFYIVNLTYTIHMMGVDYRKCILLSNFFPIIKKSFPLGISVFLLSYVTNYPRIAIESSMGPNMLAYYGSFSYVVIGLFQICNPIQTFLRQRLSKHYQNNDLYEFKVKVNKSIIGIVSLGFIYCIGFAFFRTFIIELLFTGEYNQYSSVVYILLVGQIMMSVSGILSTAVLSFNVYTKQAYISAAILLVVVLLSKSLICSQGINGAGLISIVSGTLSLLCYSLIYKMNFKKWQSYNQ